MQVKMKYFSGYDFNQVWPNFFCLEGCIAHNQG